jgi:hypothetical protein
LVSTLPLTQNLNHSEVPAAEPLHN